jgi:hypothetical protein
LFRPCPASLCKSNQPQLLVSFCMNLDAHMSGIPTSLINFVTRTVLGRIWEMLLSVARGIRDGKSPEHASRIRQKTDLYAWMNKRVQVLLDTLVDGDGNKGGDAVDEHVKFISYLQS